MSIFAGNTFNGCSNLQELKHQIQKKFNEHPHALDERRFYKDFDAIEGERLCSHLVAQKVDMGALFLDCGELSSIAEFLILEQLVPQGGYIILHDIYYPKSIKISWSLRYLISAKNGK